MARSFSTPLSPYLRFTRQEWCNFRQDTPLTLVEADLNKLRGQTEVVSLAEVEEVYLPLSRLLSFYVMSGQGLHQAANQFLGRNQPKVPYIIGIAGSVAVGKSVTSRVLQALLSRWPNHPTVELIPTDGFLYPNAELKKMGLTKRKGFPDSYDLQHLLRVLYEIKSGKHDVKIPIYSHQNYDIMPNEFEIINQPDIVIIEGLNILQMGVSKRVGQEGRAFVSDFLDFSIFVDAKREVIRQWFINRLVSFWAGSFQDPKSYFHYLTQMNEPEVRAFASQVWHEINEVNLIENILPFRNRAHLILEKSENHSVQTVFLRKL